MTGRKGLTGSLRFWVDCLCAGKVGGGQFSYLMVVATSKKKRKRGCLGAREGYSFPSNLCFSSSLDNKILGRRLSYSERETRIKAGGLLCMPDWLIPKKDSILSSWRHVPKLSFSCELGNKLEVKWVRLGFPTCRMRHCREKLLLTWSHNLVCYRLFYPVLQMWRILSALPLQVSLTKSLVWEKLYWLLCPPCACT